MEAKHDKVTLMLCLAIFIQKITIVFQWTTQRHSKLEALSNGLVEDVGGKRIASAAGEGTGLICGSGGGGSTAAATTTTTTCGHSSLPAPPALAPAAKVVCADGDSMMAQVLSHPAPIDLPDNKHKDDDLSCMSPEYFHIEENRLRTFARWPVSFVSPNSLARYGFFYVGSEDTVKCYFCRVEIGLWEPQDDVIQEHLRWSPYCALLKKRPTNNVPINANYLDAVPEPSYDTCGINIRHHSYAENDYERARADLDRMSGDSWGAASDISLSSGSSGHSGHGGDMAGVGGGEEGSSGAGVQRDRASSMTAAEWNSGRMMMGGEQSAMRRPEYPNYAIEADRLRSYEDWPTSLKQKPKQLSDAGFFYTGKSDRVKCFSCGGGLKDWEQDDEPWEQHAIWYSNCQYLQLMKGPEYIRKCNEMKEAAVAAAAASDVTGTSSSNQSTGSSASPQPSTSGISSGSSSIMSTSPVSSRGLSSPSPTGDVGEEECTLRAGSDVSGGANGGQDDAAGRKQSDGKICKICFVDEYNTAFMPCGHVVACAKCASSVNKCPLCQQPFINVLRLYLS